MIFFDLDGTLIDHDYAVKKALRKMLQSYHIKGEYSEGKIYEIWNETLEKYYNLFLEGKLTHAEQRIERMKAFYKVFGVSLSNQEVEDLFQVYLKAYENHWTLYDDVLECLQSLGDKGNRLGIISNGYLGQQNEKLRRTGISDLFEIVITSSEIGVAKPKADIFQYACDQAEVDIQDCTYIGDRWDVDAVGSQAAGMRGVHLDRYGTYNGDKNGIKVVTSLRYL